MILFKVSRGAASAEHHNGNNSSEVFFTHCHLKSASCALSRAFDLKHEDAVMLERRAGWLNVLGQFATTGTLGYITVKHLGVMWMLANGHIFSNAETFLAYASEFPSHLSALQEDSCFHHPRSPPNYRCTLPKQRVNRYISGLAPLTSLYEY